VSLLSCAHNIMFIIGLHHEYCNIEKYMLKSDLVSSCVPGNDLVWCILLSDYSPHAYVAQRICLTLQCTAMYICMHIIIIHTVPTCVHSNFYLILHYQVLGGCEMAQTVEEICWIWSMGPGTDGSWFCLSWACGHITSTQMCVNQFILLSVSQY